MSKDENNKNTKNKSIIILVTLLLICIVVLTCYFFIDNKKITPIVSSRNMMSTLVTQQIYTKDQKLGEKASAEVFTMLKSMEASLSLFIEDSDVNLINNKAGNSPVRVCENVYDLVKRSKEYSKKSNGVFDITIAPVTKAWGITSTNPMVVGEDERKELLKLVDYKKIILNDSDKSVFLQDKNMEIDLGAIAKGEACTSAENIYSKYDLTGVLLSVGGNILAMGKPSEKTDTFSIAVRDPARKETGILGVLMVTDTTISTSGSYERFFEKDGEIFHHIFDTKTAYPAQTDLISVTAVAKDGANGEYLSTTFFINGKESMLKEVKNLEPDTGIIAVDKENNVYISKSLENIFKPDENSEYVFTFI